MSRSVSVASGAVLVGYKPLEGDDDFAYDDLVEDLQSYFQAQYPSLQRTEKWLDREDRAILENRLVYIGVSEYCGLVSIWVVQKEEYPDLAAKFVRQIEPYFQKVNELRKVGTFSNGEAVFERKEI